MKLRGIYVFISLCAILMVLSSCSDDNTINNNTIPPIDTSTFTYPFTIGSTWSYQRTFSAENIRPDSILHYFNNFPVHGSGTITVLYDTIINGVTTRCFLDSYTEAATEFKSRKYYIHTDTSLLVFAYRLSATSFILPDNHSDIFFSHEGIRSESLYQLFCNIENSSSKSLTDTLIIENPPVQTLKYPIHTNKQWIYRILFPDTLYRKCLSYENLTISNHAVSCMKTELYWASKPGFKFYEHYSKYGKMKSEYEAINALISTPEHPEGIGYADFHDVSNVISYNIITP